MLSCWLFGWLVGWVVGLTMANNVGWAPLVLLILICASAYAPMLRQGWSNNGPTRSNISENNRNVQRMLGESICMSDNIHILGSLSSVMGRVRVVFRKTVVSDWPFDYQSGSHLQRVSIRWWHLCLCSCFLIGQFCRELIGCQVLKVAGIGSFFLFYCYFRSVYCLSKFEVMYESFVRCR